MLWFKEGQVLFERFQLDGCLGGGGFADVWKAKDLRLDRGVAIKRLSADGGLPTEKKKDALEEARKIAKLSHQNIIHVYDVIEDDSEALIVMEYAAGGSLETLLKTRLRQGKWLETREAFNLVHGTLSGIVAAHGSADGPIIHCDLKPANIMLVSMQPKIADFGLAAAGKIEGYPTIDRERHLLEHAGSPFYKSPEQLKGEKMDARSDLFNVGLIAFLLFGMRHPFVDDTFLHTYREMVLDGFRPLLRPSSRQQTMQGFDDWIFCLLDVNPECRFSTAEEALEELEECERVWSKRILDMGLDLADRIQRGAAGEVIANFTPGIVAEAIFQCRKSGYYVQGLRLYEQGGISFADLPEHLVTKVEDDYEFCARRSRQEVA